MRQQAHRMEMFPRFARFTNNSEATLGVCVDLPTDTVFGNLRGTVATVDGRTADSAVQVISE
jgi:DNA gyrase inhibitor GyrI